MIREKLPDLIVIAEITIFVGDYEKEVSVDVGLMIAIEEAVEEAVEEAGEEAVVTDADVTLPVDVLIGVVDVDESFVIDCVVEVAVLAVVVFAHGEATK